LEAQADPAREAQRSVNLSPPDWRRAQSQERHMVEAPPFSSADYWESRYRAGGDSGAGSHGRLAEFKAETINSFIIVNDIRSMIDFGCGDGSQLALLRPPLDYVGVDVSPAALARCAIRFPERRFVARDQLASLAPAEMTLSMDVIYHLVEDSAFADAMRSLFAWSVRFVMIYASNVDATWPAAHVRHRRFTAHVAATEKDWRLLAHLPNPFPFDPTHPDSTSFADFFVYGRADSPCSIVVPAAT
jgi:SAM-dependent methyltransferase